VTAASPALALAQSGSQPAITLVVLGSAVLHATWNAIAKGIGSGEHPRRILR
jgi:hypothetical protein